MKAKIWLQTAKQIAGTKTLEEAEAATPGWRWLKAAGRDWDWDGDGASPDGELKAISTTNDDDTLGSGSS